VGAAPARAPQAGADPSGPNAVDPSKASSPEIRRTLVAHEDIPAMQGFESRIYLIEYPPGAQAPLHAHTEQTVGFVIEGSLESAFGNGPLSLKHAGEGFVEIPREPHRFRNPDPSRPLRYVVTGAFRKEEAPFQLVPGNTSLQSAPAEPAAPPAERSPLPASAPSGALTEVRRTLVAQRELTDFPGMESRMYLCEFPPSASSKVHIHTAQGIGYVLDGSFESAFGDGPMTVKRAGDGFIDTPGLPHRFRNPDARVPLRFLVAGTYHKDEPLMKVIEQ